MPAELMVVDTRDETDLDAPVGYMLTAKARAFLAWLDDLESCEVISLLAGRGE